MEFKRGDDVEIIGNEVGFEGSYFEAIIISRVSDDDYIVQYKTLLNDDAAGPLRVFLSGEDIRPAPEDIMPENGFLLQQRVDVYLNEGWWIGEITKKFKNRYRVCFVHSEEEGVFSSTQIRLHREWINGEWV